MPKNQRDNSSACTWTSEDVDSFVQAAFDGDLDTVERLIRLGVPVDEEIIEFTSAKTAGMTALYAAACNGHVACARALLEGGASLSKTLFSEGFTHTQTELHAAIRAGSPELIDLLLQNGANASRVSSTAQTPVHCILECSTQRWQSQPDALTEAVRRLLDAGCPVNQMDAQLRTPLFEAIASGAPLAAIDLLLARGANVELYDIEGRTPLHLAVSQYPEAADRLLDKGANLLARNKSGNTVLWSAKSRRQIEELVALGVSIDAQNARGHTFLSSCLLKQGPDGPVLELVAALIEAGASLSIPDFEQNESAVNIIERRGLANVKAFLAAREARRAMGKTIDALTPRQT